MLAACGNKSADKSAPAADPIVGHIGSFMFKLADATDAAGGDCDKLATGLEGLASDAKALRAELVAAHKKLDDYKDPPPGVVERFAKLKDPAALDKCKSIPAVSKALDDTLLTIAPLGEDSALVKAFGDALGRATAVH